jgi:SAM-dependent methyltransferase
VQWDIYPARPAQPVPRRLGSLDRQGVPVRLVELDRHEPRPASGIGPQEYEDLAVHLGDALAPREVFRGVGKESANALSRARMSAIWPPTIGAGRIGAVNGEREQIIDRPYEHPVLAGLYDVLNPWGPGDAYYLELVMSARSVLDLGCGTGQLLRRAAANGHSGPLVGVDPAAAMLAEAARHADPVTWLRGDAETVDVGRSFELVTMTGHAFQVLLSDDDVRRVLANVQRHLEPEGRFAFETRNPAAKAWERWIRSTREDGSKPPAGRAWRSGISWSGRSTRTSSSSHRPADSRAGRRP